jgi:uncharacterized protein YjiS (DUF1127 family)
MSYQGTILPYETDAAPRAARPVAVSGARPHSLLGAIKALLVRWAEAESRRRTARAMLALPDHLLRDIDVSRADLRLEARRVSR